MPCGDVTIVDHVHTVPPSFTTYTVAGSEAHSLHFILAEALSAVPFFHTVLLVP